MNPKSSIFSGRTDETFAEVSIGIKVLGNCSLINTFSRFLTAALDAAVATTAAFAAFPVCLSDGFALDSHQRARREFPALDP